MTIRKKNPRGVKKEEKKKSRLVTITHCYRNSQTFNLLFFHTVVCVFGGIRGWWCRFWKSSHLICSTRYSQALFCGFSCFFCSNSSTGKKPALIRRCLSEWVDLGKEGEVTKKDSPPFFAPSSSFPFPPLFPVVVVATEAKGKREKSEAKKALDRRFPFWREILEGKESLLEGTENSMLLPSLWGEGRRAGSLIKFLSFPLPCRYFQEKKERFKKGLHNILKKGRVTSFPIPHRRLIKNPIKCWKQPRGEGGEEWNAFPITAQGELFFPGEQCEAPFPISVRRIPYTCFRRTDGTRRMWQTFTRETLFSYTNFPIHLLCSRCVSLRAIAARRTVEKNSSWTTTHTFPKKTFHSEEQQNTHHPFLIHYFQTFHPHIPCTLLFNFFFAGKVPKIDFPEKKNTQENKKQNCDV